MKKEIVQLMRPTLICFLVLTILCGLLYPGIVTGIAQIFFSNKANGSIITVSNANGDSEKIGSLLIGQTFTDPAYLIGRPNLSGSTSPSNLSVVSDEEEALVEERVTWFTALDPTNSADIPSDLVTVSGSGVDPNISPEAAEYQVARIARERGISEDAVREIISKYTTDRFLGVWGEPTVNVLQVNLALDGLL